MSVAELFDVIDTDTVWDAWLTTVNLLDIVERTQVVGDLYNFAEARSKISKTYHIAEIHLIDKPDLHCECGLSDAEHAILKRKILAFFGLQVSILKHFVI